MRSRVRCQKYIYYFLLFCNVIKKIDNLKHPKFYGPTVTKYNQNAFHHLRILFVKVNVTN